MVEEGKGDSQGVVCPQMNKEMSSPFSKATPLRGQDSILSAAVLRSTL